MLKLWNENHLTQRLGVPLATLKEVANNMPVFCSSFSSTSKSGKLREFSNPSDQLKEIQKRIDKNLLNALHIHPSAHGAVPQKSSKTNALPHLGSKYVLQLDLKSCFPNIHSTRVRKLFEKQLQCSPTVATILTKLTTFKYKLPQGFPTSPVILNLLALALDEKISSFIATKGLIYTRYIDDITISGDYISEKTCCRVKKIIENEGFILNLKKEFLSQGETAPIVTGINTSGSSLKTPRNLKKRVRAIEHTLKKVSGKSEEKKIKLQNTKKGIEAYTAYIEK